MSDPTRLNRLFVGGEREAPTPNDNIILECGKGFFAFPRIKSLADLALKINDLPVGAFTWVEDLGTAAFLRGDKSFCCLPFKAKFDDVKAFWDAAVIGGYEDHLIGGLFFATDKGRPGFYSSGTGAVIL